MTEFNAILNAIKMAKNNNTKLTNTDILSIFKATKSIAENKNIINAIIKLQSHLNIKEIEKLNQLTKREKQILTLIGQSKLTKTIATELNLSKSTIETHRKNIRKKLKLNGKKKLYEYALIYNFSLDNEHEI